MSEITPMTSVQESAPLPNGLERGSGRGRRLLLGAIVASTLVSIPSGVASAYKWDVYVAECSDGIIDEEASDQENADLLSRQTESEPEVIFYINNVLNNEVYGWNGYFPGTSEFYSATTPIELVGPNNEVTYDNGYRLTEMGIKTSYPTVYAVQENGVESSFTVKQNDLEAIDIPGDGEGAEYGIKPNGERVEHDTSIIPVGIQLEPGTNIVKLNAVFKYTGEYPHYTVLDEDMTIELPPCDGYQPPETLPIVVEPEVTTTSVVDGYADEIQRIESPLTPDTTTSGTTTAQATVSPQTAAESLAPQNQELPISEKNESDNRFLKYPLIVLASALTYVSLGGRLEWLRRTASRIKSLE